MTSRAKTREPAVSKQQDHQALAGAVRDRRTELGMTQEQAADLTRRIDIEILHSDNHRQRLGISRSTWASIEQAEEVERRAHTQDLLDRALRWPSGTARAHLYGLEMPVGPPAEGLDSVTGEADTAASRAETLRARAEVADLRAEVAEMVLRFESLQQQFEAALKAIERG